MPGSSKNISCHGSCKSIANVAQGTLDCRAHRKRVQSTHIPQWVDGGQRVSGGPTLAPLLVYIHAAVVASSVTFGIFQDQVVSVGDFYGLGDIGAVLVELDIDVEVVRVFILLCTSTASAATTSAVLVPDPGSPRHL